MRDTAEGKAAAEKRLASLRARVDQTRKVYEPLITSEQTAKATGEIGAQIAGIQSATQESVSAIQEIGGTIERLSEVSSAIAAAVEEQGASTQVLSAAKSLATDSTRLKVEVAQFLESVRAA